MFKKVLFFAVVLAAYSCTKDNSNNPASTNLFKVNATTVNDTISTTIRGGATDIEAHVQMINLTDAYDVTWEKLNENAPAGWSFAICDKITCYSSSKLSSNFTLNRNDTCNYRVHCYNPTNQAGTAYMDLKMYKTGDQSSAKTVRVNFVVTN
jgi:hypothetical protein